MPRRIIRRQHWTMIIAVVPLVAFAFAATLDAAEPLGLKPIRHPKDNKPTPEKIQLGKQLYFDPRAVSRQYDFVCIVPRSRQGVQQRGTVRDGCAWAGWRPQLANDHQLCLQPFPVLGRTRRQPRRTGPGPIQNPIEMDMTLEEVVERLNGIEGYRAQFQKVFGTDVTAENIGRAIAAYERTVLSGDAPYDRFKDGDESALSEAAQRGMKLFFGKANCSACHAGSNFTDNAFHNIGVGMEVDEPDQGRFVISSLGGDTGSFKTPTLREIARTAPYMHDGSMKTLEEVIAHYNKGGGSNPYLDEEMFPLNLTQQQQADLVTFLKEGLSSENYPNHQPPELP